MYAGQGFERNTRNKFVNLPTLTKPTGGGLTAIQLPKSGLLARIWLSIAVTTAGTLTTVNALGIASAIRRVKLTTNAGLDLFNMSGAGFAYLFQNMMELGGVNGRQPKNQGSTVPVTATTYNLDMVIPLQINAHDPVGLIMLQNEQLQVNLSVEWETDSNVILTGGGTLTGTCKPVLEFFTKPVDPRDLPNLNVIQQIIEDQYTVSVTGDYIIEPPRGNVYMQILLGYGIGTTAADNWSRLIMRVNQAEIIYDIAPSLVDQRVGYYNNLTRGLGFIPIDMLGSDGLGAYGSARDFLNTKLLTDLQLVLTTTATGTAYIIRRMLLPLQ